MDRRCINILLLLLFIIIIIIIIIIDAQPPYKQVLRIVTSQVPVK